MAFVIESLKTIFIAMTGITWLTTTHYAFMVFALFSPLAWERKIETFKMGFMFGFIMIIVVLIVISCFCVNINLNRVGGGPAPGFIAFNEKSFWSMIGFSFFQFEGIGGVMPIMAIAKDRK